METDECVIMAPDKAVEPLPDSVTCRKMNTPRQRGTEEKRNRRNHSAWAALWALSSLLKSTLAVVRVTESFSLQFTVPPISGLN